MTETQKRIRQFQQALPSLREKVVSVAILLVLSVTMMASVSYAWVTLSTKPQLGGVSTTVSANGNLELALSDFDGLPPDASGIHDSFSATDQTVHAANTSWGNLVNLSGNYGLESLTLRPATLDLQSSALLAGVKYGEDGRVEGAATDFAFTTWAIKDSTLGSKDFVVPPGDAFGVRAISSVGYPDGKGELQQKLDNATAINSNAVTNYNTILHTDRYVTAIESIVQKYLDGNVQAFLNGTGQVNISYQIKEVEPIRDIYVALYDDVLCVFGDALAYLANIQQGFKSDDYTPYTRETLVAASATELIDNGVNLGNSLATYKSVSIQLAADRDILNGYINSGRESIGWQGELESVINRLIDIDTVTVDGKTAAQLLADKSDALAALGNMKGRAVPIVINKDTADILRIERLTGARMDSGNPVRLDFSVNVPIVGGNYYGHMKTKLTPTDSSLFSMDRSQTEAMSDQAENKGRMVAEDTYGMVLDLWFRTNSAGTNGQGTVLALDGVPAITKTSQPRMITLSGETESRLVYAYERPTGQEIEGVKVTEEILVYKDGEYYYRCDSYEQVFVAEEVERSGVDDEGNPCTYIEVVDTETPISDGDVTQKFDIIETVDGYHSSNRIWKDGELVLDSGEVSATQGSGSCYVFYADTPEASAGALQLLRQMRLAFIDSNDNLLTQAKMDVDHVFSQSGKHLVPIVVDNSSYETVNAKGEIVYGVANLLQNVPTRISVVVYLDGIGLENSMVMANESIRGNLNLQFAVMEDLRSMKDTDVAMDTVSLRTDITETQFTYAPNTTFAPTLTAYVEGLSPSSVQAVFQRRINASQGTQMPPVTLNNDSGSIWSNTASFSKPGTYVLSSLLIDGVEYDLPESEIITVTVDGFAVGSVSFCEAPGENLALTADRSVTRDVTVSFTADIDKQPQTVEVRLMSEDGKTSVPATLTRNGDFWTGTATFNSSGTYTLQYLVLDGDYSELDESFQKTFTAYLGLRARVYLQREGGLEFDFTGDEAVGIRAEILTDTDAMLKGMENVVLRYAIRGSTMLENGLTAELTWQNGYYEGEFNVDKVGVFNFGQMQVGTNVINSAISAPTITSRSKEPPKFENVLSDELMIHTADTPAVFVVHVSNATSATKFEAVFKNGTQPQQVVTGTQNGDTYSFSVPNNSDGNKNGVWTISELRFYGVYDENGDFYGAGDGAVAAYYVEPLPNKSCTVIDQFAVSLGNPLTFGNRTSAAFMTGHSLDGLGATIGLSGVSLPDALSIGNVQLTLEHNGDNATYGGYTFKTADDAGNPIVNPLSTLSFSSADGTLTQNSDGKWVVPAGTMIRLAGTYDYTLTFDLMGDAFKTTTFTFTGDRFITVSSMTPTVHISSISPEGRHSAAKAGFLGLSVSYFNVTSSISNNNHTATVYAEVVKSGRNPALQTYPRAVLTLNGAGNSSASMTFTTTNNNGTVYMYPQSGNDGGRTNAYTWASGTTECTRYLGYNDAGNCSNSVVAGTLTSNTIILAYSNVEYTVNLNYTITLNNPAPS